MATQAQPIGTQAIEARALARHVRISPQKARLVIDLIRGQRAEDARQVLRFTKKRAARLIEKVLMSAVHNAERKAEDARETLDTDQLYVSQCYVNEGPRWKRLRPAPMGRAFRYQKRTSHIIVCVSEHRAAVAERAAMAAAEAAQTGVKGAVKKVRKRIAASQRAREGKPGKGKGAGTGKDKGKK
ncbi:MAG: 50S ribosomal protein L22 [Candidatus Acidiferrales bacterium]